MRLQRDLYRVMIRCYALELFPVEVTSCDRFEASIVSVADPIMYSKDLAVGARFKIKGSPLKFDPWARMNVTTKEIEDKNRRKIVPPVLDIKGGWWATIHQEDHPIQEEVSDDELSLYKMKAARVFARWRTVNFYNKGPSYPSFAKMPPNLRLPYFRKSFTKPFPGAVVEVPGGQVGWVVREVAANVVIVEIEKDDYDLEEETHEINNLRLLG